MCSSLLKIFCLLHRVDQCCFLLAEPTSGTIQFRSRTKVPILSRMFKSRAYTKWNAIYYSKSVTIAVKLGYKNDKSPITNFGTRSKKHHQQLLLLRHSSPECFFITNFGSALAASIAAVQSPTNETWLSYGRRRVPFRRIIMPVWMDSRAGSFSKIFFIKLF